MCGIAGVFSYKKLLHVDELEIKKMCKYMHFRGPDSFGNWFSEQKDIGFGHTRLSIIDLSSRASQPMTSSKKHLTIVFNGEIYNFIELKEMLQQHGYIFNSNSDTEVLLNLYDKYGHEMVNYLKGMYAFAIWDEINSGLFLARDPYGIKPLYYSDYNGVFRFSSVVKGLLSTNAIPKDNDPAGIVGFYLQGYVPEPHTTYKYIKSLDAGSTLWIKRNSNKQIKKYFSIAKCFYEGFSNPYPEDDYQEILKDSFHKSISRHLVSDVPIGAFLSAGIDSCSIVGVAAPMLQKINQNLYTLTLGFDEFKRTKDDETIYAKEVANYFNTIHTTKIIDKNLFEENISHILNIMDQPSVDGINTWFVSQAAKNTGLKVMLSGLGGDELLGGYSSFYKIPKAINYLQYFKYMPKFSEITEYIGIKLNNYLLMNPKYVSLLKYSKSFSSSYFIYRALFLPWELKEILDPDLIEDGIKSLNLIEVMQDKINTSSSEKAIISSLESAFYMRNQLLRDSDWASMDNSIELRTPLVDLDLLKTVSRIPLNKNKSLKKMLAMSTIKPLPSNILNKRKTGFSTPIENWMNKNPNLSSWKENEYLNNKNISWSKKYGFSINSSRDFNKKNA